MRTPPPWSRRRLRELRRGWRRRNVSLHVAGAVFLVVAGATTTVLCVAWPGPTGAVSWYVLGATHVALVGIVLHLLESAFVMHEREAMRHVRGSAGEDNTRSELLTARRQGLVWGWVDSIDTAGGDLDHLVVTRRGGLVAMDSKFRTFVDHGHPEAMAVAARRTRVRAQGVATTALGPRDHGRRRTGSRLPVRSVVVVWGAAQHTLPPGGVEIDEVHFVAGRGLRQWLRALDGDPVDRDAAEDLLDRLRDLRARSGARATT